MKEKSAWTLFVSVWMLSVVFNSVLVDADDDHDEYEYLYMEDYCTGNPANVTTIFVGQDGRSPYGILKATRSDYIPPYMNCELKLQVQSEHHLTTRFKELELGCSGYDDRYVEIVGETNKSTKFCGHNEPAGSLYSVGSWLKFKFVTGTNAYSEDGFAIAYTDYYPYGCQGQDPDEFQCSIEARCIDADVKCDGIDNCGDWSDEWSSACGLRPKRRTDRALLDERTDGHHRYAACSTTVHLRQHGVPDGGRPGRTRREIPGAANLRRHR